MTLEFALWWMINKRSYFAGGVLTPPPIKISQRGCSPLVLAARQVVLKILSKIAAGGSDEKNDT
jgi:hypothetical protein